MSAVQSRFEKFVDRHPDGCWTWMGAKTSKGYGRFHLDGNKHAHRVAFEIYKGEIPAGLVLDHLCRTPSCVNPDHLEPVTLVENIKRGDHFGKGWKRNITHCPKGHEYSDENTYIARLVKRNVERRVCKTCNRELRQRAKGIAS